MRIALGLIVLAVLLPDPAAAQAKDSSQIVYITPAGEGRRDGSSWSHAATLSRLPTLLAKAGPGGKIYIRADLGAYETQEAISINGGGTPGRPITVMGVDGAERPMKAQIVGTRSDPYRPDGAPGREVFRLTRGANHLHFAHLSFRNQGNGCFRIVVDIRDLTIEHVHAQNVRRFIENSAGGSARSASVDGLVVRHVEVSGFSKGAMRLQYNSRNVLLEDITGDSERQDGDNFAEGIALEGTVHNVVLRRVTMRNSHDSLHRYWNGDGFVTEENTYRIRFEDTVASGNTDAGYDLKSSDTVLVRAVAEDNKRNFKLWGRGITVLDCVAARPHHRGGTGPQDQVNVLKGADVIMKGCRLTDSDPKTVVFHLQEGRLRVHNTIVSKHEKATTVLDEGGSLEFE
jgi:hypothetical protein